MTPDARTWPPHSLLGGLPPGELLRFGSVRSFDGGETLLVEGDRDSRDVYVLLDGVVKVVSNTVEGSAVVLSIRADGDLVGELAGLAGRSSYGTGRGCTRPPGSARFLRSTGCIPPAGAAGPGVEPGVRGTAGGIFPDLGHPLAGVPWKSIAVRVSAAGPLGH